MAVHNAPRHRHGITVRWVAALTLASLVTSPPHEAAASSTCRGAIQHPIQVRIEALDPVRSSAVVRLRMEVTSTVALDGVRAQVVGAAAPVVSAREARLTALLPGRPGTFEFRVRVPAERTLIQFRVEGEGPGGRLARGAAYNLMPGGPAEQGRVVTREDGARLLEVTARRVGP